MGFDVVVADVVVFVVNGRVGGGCFTSYCSETEIIAFVLESLSLIHEHAEGTLDTIAHVTSI